MYNWHEVVYTPEMQDTVHRIARRGILEDDYSVMTIMNKLADKLDEYERILNELPTEVWWSNLTQDQLHRVVMFRDLYEKMQEIGINLDNFPHVMLVVKLIELLDQREMN